MTRDGSQAGSRMIEAGRRAEEQMKHYLERAFDGHSSVRLLHDVRLERDGQAVQMDHLVVHRYGIAIIESKSVSTTVRITPTGEWERLVGRTWQGMPSPLLQAGRQGELLKRILTDNKAGLLDRVLMGMVQGGFTNMALDTLIAISDKGRIQRPSPDAFPEVMKADQVAGKIREKLRKYRAMNATFNLSLHDINNAPRMFTEREVNNITGFLRARHTDRFRTAVAESGNDVFAVSTVPTLRCNDCATGLRFIDWRKGTGYHFRCRSCDMSEVIRVSCPRCTRRARISKRGNDFSLVCKGCDIQVPYFSNEP